MSTIIICRTCGRELELHDGKNLINCPGCSTSNSRPQTPRVEKLNRATRLRLDKEFDEAEQCYQTMLTELDDQHEALWGRLLCHYGVESIDRDDGQERILIVHRPRRVPMQSTSDFQQACRLAPPEIRSQYEADAAYVDNEQAELRLMAENVPPYDVFLCHKTTLPGTNGLKTDDYDHASQLYHYLTNQGFNVFFAPRELQGVLGSNYGAGITYALQTSRVMLVICSDPDYLNSCWVKSEWQRFMAQMEKDADPLRPAQRALRPLFYGGMKASLLPQEFAVRKLQGITMDGPTAHDSLIRVLRTYCTSRKPQGPYATEPAEGGLCITSYNGPGGNLEIPSFINDQPVVEIGENAFRDNATIAAVNIPEGVRRVAASAFWNCPGLRFVQLPASLTSIAQGAFGSCTALKTLLLAPGNTSFCLRGTVLYTTGNALVCYPAGLTEEEFEVSEGTLAAWQNAFAGCLALRRVTFPDTVRFIARGAFSGCAALAIRAHANTPAQQYALENSFPFEAISTHTPEMDFVTAPAPGGLAITDYTGPGGDVTIPAAIGGKPVVAIADYGLAAGRPIEMNWDVSRSTASTITHLELPQGLTRIGNRAFDGCRALTAIVIPGSVRSIGDGAFKDCTALTGITLPEGVTDLGDWVFHGCSSLTGVSLPTTLASIDDCAFMGCKALKRVILPEGVMHLGKQAFMNCTSLERIHLPASLSSITGNPFMGCTALHTFIISAANPVYIARNGTLMTRDGTLVCCPAGLTAPEFTLPEDVKAIGPCAFRGCTSLKSVTLHAGVTSIGEWAFDLCPGLTLRVYSQTFAHQYAQQNSLRSELLDAPRPAAPASVPAPAPAPAPRQPAGDPAQYATLHIRRSLLPSYASRKICVRVEGQELFQIGNGESYVLRKLKPGHIRIDIKLKPTVGNVNWNTRGGLNNIFPTEMKAGEEYTLDVARYLSSLS